MIIFKNIEIKKFRNIKSAKLNDLKDLNILIGPNNCGKTNILELISSLRNLSTGRSYAYCCEECTKLKERNKDIEGINLLLNHNDFYLGDLKKVKITLTILLNREQIDRLVPKVLQKQRERLNKITALCPHIKDVIVMENIGSGLYGKHFSPFIHEDIIEEIKRPFFIVQRGAFKAIKGKDLLNTSEK